MQPHVLEFSSRWVALWLLHHLAPKDIGRHCRARATAPPAHPLSPPAHVGGQCRSSGGIPAHPPPKEEPSCRAGGWERQAARERQVTPRRLGIGDNLPKPSAPAANVLWHGCQTLLAACFGHTRCSGFGPPVVTNAPWPSFLCSRDCPAHPPPLAAKAPWPPRLHSRQCPAHPPPKAEPSCRAGGWERHAPRAAHLLPRFMGNHEKLAEESGPSARPNLSIAKPR
jgi:hypothetical protein